MTPETVSTGEPFHEADTLSRGNFYAEGLYLRTQPQRGVTRNRVGTRLVSLSEDFLNGFRRAIEDECGPAADVVFKSCGRKWGELLARRFVKELSEFYARPVQEFSVAMFLACLTEMFSHHGWGKLTLDLSHHEQGVFVAELRGAIVAALAGQAQRPADAMMAGIFAGFFSHLSGQDLDCLQTACTACGAAESRFLVALRPRLAPAEAWRDEGRSHDDILESLLNASC